MALTLNDALDTLNRHHPCLLPSRRNTNTGLSRGTQKMFETTIDEPIPAIKSKGPDLLASFPTTSEFVKALHSVKAEPLVPGDQDCGLDIEAAMATIIRTEFVPPTQPKHALSPELEESLNVLLPRLAQQGIEVVDDRPIFLDQPRHVAEPPRGFFGKIKQNMLESGLID